MAARHIVGNHYPSYKPIGMNKKKEILKDAVGGYMGKGGPVADTLNNLYGGMRNAVKGGAAMVGRGIKRYKDFAAEEKSVSDQANREMGPTSSNASNMEEQSRLMKRIREDRKKAKTASSTPQ